MELIRSKFCIMFVVLVLGVTVISCLNNKHFDSHDSTSINQQI